MTYVNDANALKAKQIIKGLEKRNMEGYYAATKEDLLSLILPMFEAGSKIAWGGSATLSECGLLDALINSGNYEMIDRMQAKNPEEARAFFAKSVLSDYYLMSSNAITLDGQLINIDGNGNRVACLIQGPKQVFLIVGMNKVVTDVPSGIERVRNVATPPNTLRLNKKTPCTQTGKCEDCYAPDCICNQIVVTRRSGHTGRIKVFLVGESLGF